ncbi:hypothetical protein KCU90_g14, partial [Aureobasidium melanogenum]
MACKLRTTLTIGCSLTPIRCLTHPSFIQPSPNMSLTRQLPRTTDETINITRWPGKIAIEEACGSPFFNANQTIPRAPLIHGFKGKLPFSDEVIADVEKRLNDTKLRIQSMDQSGIEFEIVSLTSPGIEGVCDPKLAAEYARKTNDWMYETFVKA